MFWLFKKNVDDNFKFNMKFLNYRKSMIDDEEILVFENTNKLLNYDYNITCLVSIKENLIKFENDKINCCFRIKEDIFNDSGVLERFQNEEINILVANIVHPDDRIKDLYQEYKVQFIGCEDIDLTNLPVS